MKIKVKIFPWESPMVCDSGNWGLDVGDSVVLNLESGSEAGRVEEVNVKDDSPEIPKIVRKATSVDVETLNRNREKAKEAINVCKNLVKEKALPMKIVDAHFSFDGGKIVFSFIAEKRVDFRDLVKILSKNFQRSIRLQQIGSRDEARGKGGFGACGRELCCIKFSGSLKSVTTDDARVQQMGQRGSERLSGLCGRLKCCLGFESDVYRKALAKMPDLGTEIIVEGKKAIVKDRHILEEEVTAMFDDKSAKRVPLGKIKQKK
ncbi:MAG: regulatory iron-sulfur-containing complex subunit RicT [Candidatus Paceibacterota bacterium]|jgi:cell fate regulator YaaT (PSP1 superfamily)